MGTDLQTNMRGLSTDFCSPIDSPEEVINVTAGNQGAAYDKAVEALNKNPSDSALKAEVDRTRAAVNQSLSKAGQKTID